MPVPPKKERPVVFWLLLGLGLAHSLLYVLLAPPWQHYDEPTHFEYAWLIANRLHLPQLDEYDQNMRREVAASMAEHVFFHESGVIPDLLAQDEPIWIGISELSHPPLYYILVAVPLWLLRSTDIVLQLYAARLVSLLMYLSVIGFAYQLICEIFPSISPLRWLIPGFLVFLPAFTDLMTAVNNDVGAVFFLSLFSWLAVRTIMRGVSIWRLVGLVGAAIAGMWTKNTAGIAVLLTPVVLVLACWPQRWSAQLGIASLLGGAVLLLTVFQWDGVAAWYPSSSQTGHINPSMPETPWGQRAFCLQITPANPDPQIIQFVTRQDIAALRGTTVTLGAWIWATESAFTNLPVLYDSLNTTSRAVQVGETPTFYTLTATISGDTNDIQIILRPMPSWRTDVSRTVCYDGVMLIQQDHIPGTPTLLDSQGRQLGWQKQVWTNLARNGSAENTIPTTHPWVDRWISTYARRSSVHFVASICEWERTGWAHRVTAQRLLSSFWATFAWNSVHLAGGWYITLIVITLVGMSGAVVMWIRLIRHPSSWRQNRTALFLTLIGLLIWGNTFLRPFPFSSPASPFLPVARYAYPAIIPSALALVGGWWVLTPKRFRRWFPLALFSFLVLLDMVSPLTVLLFFYGR